MRKTNEQKILVKFGSGVSRIRTQKSITQAQLAEKTGLVRMIIAFVESGRRWPGTETISLLAKGLGVKIEDLFNGYDTPIATDSRNALPPRRNDVSARARRYTKFLQMIGCTQITTY